MNKIAIKQLVKTKGWQEVLNVFDEEITKSLIPENFHTEGKTPEVIAVECMARERASKLVKAVIGRITSAGNETDLEKQSYK